MLATLHQSIIFVTLANHIQVFVNTMTFVFMVNFESSTRLTFEFESSVLNNTDVILKSWMGALQLIFWSSKLVEVLLLYHILVTASQRQWLVKSYKGISALGVESVNSGARKRVEIAAIPAWWLDGPQVQGHERVVFQLPTTQLIRRTKSPIYCKLDLHLSLLLPRAS